MTFNLSIGADPELFVREKSTGRFVSAHDLMPGTKTTPHPVPSGAIQVDGVAAEFNIDPAKTDSSFVGNISTVMGELRKTLGEKYELVADPSVTFPEDYFKSLPENIRELGCNPDFNAYTGQVTEKPDGSSTTLRTAAGHVHIGFRKDGDPTNEIHVSDCEIIVKNLDCYLGLFSLIWDQDKKRRNLYGKAGSYRPKSYGLEYRPLSNVWLRTTPLQAWVFNTTRKCLSDLMVEGRRPADDFKEGLVREFIDNSESWWNEEDDKKSKDHRKIRSTIFQLTGLKMPPPLPKPVDAKVVTKADPKHKYKDKKDPFSAWVDDMAKSRKQPSSQEISEMMTFSQQIQNQPVVAGTVLEA